MSYPLEILIDSFFKINMKFECFSSLPQCPPSFKSGALWLPPPLMSLNSETKIIYLNKQTRKNRSRYFHQTFQWLPVTLNILWLIRPLSKHNPQLNIRYSVPRFWQFIQMNLLLTYPFLQSSPWTHSLHLSKCNSRASLQEKVDVQLNMTFRLKTYFLYKHVPWTHRGHCVL